MTCVNCRARHALLRGADRRTPLPAAVGPWEVFETVLRVDDLDRRPFTVRFDLVADVIRSAPVLLEETIVAEGWHSCGLTVQGRACCWGANGAGQLGDGTTVDRRVPTPVAGGLIFK
jgi:hypothetical protein